MWLVFFSFWLKVRFRVGFRSYSDPSAPTEYLALSTPSLPLPMLSVPNGFKVSECQTLVVSRRYAVCSVLIPLVWECECCVHNIVYWFKFQYESGNEFPRLQMTSLYALCILLHIHISVQAPARSVALNERGNPGNEHVLPLEFELLLGIGGDLS